MVFVKALPWNCCCCSTKERCCCRIKNSCRTKPFPRWSEASIDLHRRSGNHHCTWHGLSWRCFHQHVHQILPWVHCWLPHCLECRPCPPLPSHVCHQHVHQILLWVHCWLPHWMEYRPCPPHLSHVCHQYYLWHHCCEWSPSQALISFINIFGGFIVTKRMLKMFKSSTDPQSTPTSWEVLRLPCLPHMGMLWPTDTQIFTRWATSHPVCVVWRTGRPVCPANC